MSRSIRLTRGALTLLKKKYAAILGKCLVATFLATLLSVPALADIPAPGSSFNVSGNMSFQNQGSLSYGFLTGDPGSSLTLEATSIEAQQVEMTTTDVTLTDSSLNSAGYVNIHGANLANGHLSAAQNLTLNAPLNLLSGLNTLSSSGKDINLAYGINLAGGATLDIDAAGEITGSGIHANNLHADYVSIHNGATFENGTLFTANEQSPSAFFGDVFLRNMDTQMGRMMATSFTVSGGTFSAGEAQFYGPATFAHTQAEIGNLIMSAPLVLQDSTTLTISGDAPGSYPITMDASTLNVMGDLVPLSLEVNNSAIKASGDFKLDMADFQLRDTNIAASNITLSDFTSSGGSALEAAASIDTQNITVAGGQLLMLANMDNGAVRGTDLQMEVSATVKVASAQASFNNIQGSGSLVANNLSVNKNLSLAQGSATLTGQTNIGGDMTLNGVKAAVQDINVQGLLELQASSLNGRTVNLAQGGRLDNTSILEARSLTAEGNIVMASNAELLAGDMQLGSANLILESASGERTVAAVGNFASGDLNVGNNSLLSVGNIMPDWANMGMDGHRASAALGLWTPFQLGSGALAAVGANTSGRAWGGNQVHFTSDSLLITNASVAAADGAGAISAQSPAQADIAAGAKLHILHAQKDSLYRVLGDNITVNYEGDAWQGENVRTDTRLIQLERLEGDKLGWFQAKSVSASDSLPGLTPPISGGIDDAGNKGQIPPETDNIPTTPIIPSLPDAPDTPIVPDVPDKPSEPEPDNPETPDVPVTPDTPDTPDEPYDPIVPEQPSTHVYTPGQRFLSRALNFWFIGHDGHLAAQTIESACRILALGAVPEMTLAANDAGARAMQARTGATGSGAPQAVNSAGENVDNTAEGFALWITPLYKSVNGYSLSAGNWNTDVNGGLGGVALGADYTFANNLRLGLSFNVGGGYARGNGELSPTTNSMSFWGIGAYAGWNWENLDAAADVAYTSTYNRLKQDLVPAMQMDDLKSDITAWALSAGLEVGWTLRTELLDIRPHAGVRYHHWGNDSYDVNSGGTVLEGKAKGVDYWTFPLGVSFQKEFDLGNGWHFQPTLDLAVIPTAGENRVESEVRFTGTDTWLDLKDQFRDDVTYRGSLGLQLNSTNLTFGLNYTMETGLKTNSQAVLGTFVYTF